MRRRQHLHAIALWLALIGVFYRALIPTELMPASAAQARQGLALTLCAGGVLKSDGGAQHSPLTNASHAVHCPFAMAGVAPAPARFFIAFASPQGVTAIPSPLAATLQTARSRPPARAPPKLV